MEDPARSLPDDVLADVLARLAPRSLAVSRCVCKDWRAIVDERCRLHPDLLPLSLGGIFILTHEPQSPDFFARPVMAHRIAGKLDNYVDTDRYNKANNDYPYIEDCCNGLLLLDGHVVNPATRQWARLPPCPAMSERNEDDFGYYSTYLVFDPTLSPHYEVLSMHIPFDCEGKLPQGLEWPPSSYIMHVFSSRTRRWEERPFALEEEFEGTMDGVRSVSGHAALWHEALYVHCNSNCIMRISLSNDKYRVIKLPAAIDASMYHTCYLGKSKNGIYFATVIQDQCRLHVWFLDESGGKMKWVLKHGINMRAVTEHFWNNRGDQTDRPWILQYGKLDQENNKGPNTQIVEKDSDWDSDDDNAIDIKDCDDKGLCGPTIFGFHPYKEIVFVCLLSERVVAYHLESSRVQDLGKLCLKYVGHMMDTAYIYTPCWSGELSEN